jgi:sporulation protein YqfC
LLNDEGDFLMPLKKNKRNKEQKSGLKMKVTEALELPKEIVLNMPKLTMLGSGDLIIENYKGVIEYSEEKVRINTASGIIKISGSNLIIKEITAEDIIIKGIISSLEFLK